MTPLDTILELVIFSTTIVSNFGMENPVNEKSKIVIKKSTNSLGTTGDYYFFGEQYEPEINARTFLRNWLQKNVIKKYEKATQELTISNEFPLRENEKISANVSEFSKKMKRTYDKFIRDFNEFYNSIKLNTRTVDFEETVAAMRVFQFKHRTTYEKLNNLFQQELEYFISSEGKVEYSASTSSSSTSKNSSQSSRKKTARRVGVAISALIPKKPKENTQKLGKKIKPRNVTKENQTNNSEINYSINNELLTGKVRFDNEEYEIYTIFELGLVAFLKEWYYRTYKKINRSMRKLKAFRLNEFEALHKERSEMLEKCRKDIIEHDKVYRQIIDHAISDGLINRGHKTAPIALKNRILENLKMYETKLKPTLEILAERERKVEELIKKIEDSVLTGPSRGKVSKVQSKFEGKVRIFGSKFDLQFVRRIGIKQLMKIWNEIAVVAPYQRTLEKLKLLSAEEDSTNEEEIKTLISSLSESFNDYSMAFKERVEPSGKDESTKGVEYEIVVELLDRYQSLLKATFERFVNVNNRATAFIALIERNKKNLESKVIDGDENVPNK